MKYTRSWPSVIIYSVTTTCTTQTSRYLINFHGNNEKVRSLACSLQSQQFKSVLGCFSLNLSLSLSLSLPPSPSIELKWFCWCEKSLYVYTLRSDCVFVHIPFLFCSVLFSFAKFCLWQGKQSVRSICTTPPLSFVQCERAPVMHQFEICGFFPFSLNDDCFQWIHVFSFFFLCLFFAKTFF